MDPIEAAAASGDAISGLASHFMLDMATYARGGELGYEGLDFYIAGRGGVLGDVPAGVVAAALVFFEPATVTAAWERTAGLLPRLEAGAEFAAIGHRWAEATLPDDLDLARLAELAGKLVAGASPAGAPLFAGWRALPELRGALHGAAVLAQGIDLHAAVAFRSPVMTGIFGWAEPHPDGAAVKERWKEAQAGTERAMAPTFEALSAADRAEFVTLANAAQAAVTGG